MQPQRKRSHLALELLGTVLFGWMPDWRFVNEGVAQLYYWWINGRRADLKNPQSFNEKMILSKLSAEGRSQARRTITDKEFVKTRVTALIGPGHVVPTLAILRTIGEIDRFEFPLPCVVKPTHSSQEIMVFETAQPTRDQRRSLKYWLIKSYFSANREPNYKGLEHKLIVEPVVGGAFGSIDDIKVFCFHGRPKLIQIDRGRFRGEHRRDFYDVDGQFLPIEIKYPSEGAPFDYRAQLHEIVALSRTLSAGFDFLRVDFYISGGEVIVGELTSYPSNCVHDIRPPEADRIVAALFEDPDLPITPEAFGMAAAATRAAVAAAS
jgi:hypothetical protein